MNKNESQLMNTMGPVLFHYDLQPTHISSQGKVHKVTTHYGTFALKRTTMSQEQAEWFVHVMRRLERIDFPFFVPVLPTKYGDYTVFDGQFIYYLMPWYEDHHTFRHGSDPEEAILEELAKLHGLTERTRGTEDEPLEKSFQQLKERWDLRKLKMEKYLDEMEKHTYYSPFELTLLTHFERTKQVANEAEKYLEKWLETAKEKKHHRSVLCHGRPNRSHACFDEYGTAYFINFERAVQDTPARDTALLFRHLFQVRPWDEHDGKHWLSIYEKHFAFFDDEKYLFISYLLFPENIYQMVDHFTSPSRQKSEMHLVMQLERRLLTMKRIFRFVTSISKLP
ncbi:spore coat protein YsxE [Salipaludibacillus sp. LMS25]|jgi:spore coat protein YsxE|uniref:spore coat protein YsxE n=1 Tax=Salipaludibacillus sp. LMS25 TaxID=2924031 RepID=UPI0020D10A2B|nr:spore coat protein YsxE [Salipaludibacillus sp. LMS25]UTR15482.1 spore coat protein YsxE [Salipaludibacillus sp. LMS25]